MCIICLVRRTGHRGDGAAESSSLNNIYWKICYQEPGDTGMSIFKSESRDDLRWWSLLWRHQATLHSWRRGEEHGHGEYPWDSWHAGCSKPKLTFWLIACLRDFIKITPRPSIRKSSSLLICLTVRYNYCWLTEKHCVLWNGRYSLKFILWNLFSKRNQNQIWISSLVPCLVEAVLQIMVNIPGIS